jgi:hypothetical protein
VQANVHFFSYGNYNMISTMRKRARLLTRRSNSVVSISSRGQQDINRNVGRIRGAILAGPKELITC